MANAIDNVIEIDGKMVLDETLGAYNRVSLNSYSNARDLYVTLGNWSDTLGLIEDDSLYESVDSGYIEGEEEDRDEILERLKEYSEEELRGLSERLIEDGWEIPDEYKIEIRRVYKEDEVYIEGIGDIENEYIVKIKIGRGRIKIRGIEGEIKARMRDIINGIKMMSCSGIREKE